MRIENYVTGDWGLGTGASKQATNSQSSIVNPLTDSRFSVNNSQLSILNCQLPSRSPKNHSQSALGTLRLYLSTIVEAFMWISVYILPDKALQLFCVDRWCISPHTYPQVIHAYQPALSACNSQAPKKKLDRLSTYPQSLLNLLNYKIYLI